MSAIERPYHPARVRLATREGQLPDDIFVRFACAQFYSVALGTQSAALNQDFGSNFVKCAPS